MSERQCSVADLSAKLLRPVESLLKVPNNRSDCHVRLPPNAHEASEAKGWTDGHGRHS